MPHVNMSPVGLENTKISIDVAQKPLDITLNVVFSVTYYLELHNTKYLLQSNFFSSKDINVL